MKTLKYYIPFDYTMAQEERINPECMILRSGNYYSPNIELANKQLSIWLSCAIQKAMEDNPNAEMSISVKRVDNICDREEGYVLRVVFGDPSEHNSIEKYMEFCSKEIKQ